MDYYYQGTLCFTSFAFAIAKLGMSVPRFSSIGEIVIENASHLEILEKLVIQDAKS